MKKIVFLALILSLASGFDIDDYDRGNEALNAGDYATAYEIFYDGCEQKDVLSCEALGDMFVNEEINEQMDKYRAWRELFYEKLRPWLSKRLR